LRLAKARTLEEAQAVLGWFPPRRNRTFTRPTAEPESDYQPLNPDLDPAMDF